MQIVSKILLWIGVALFLISLCMPSVYYGGHDGPVEALGIVAVCSTPVFIYFGFISICLGRFGLGLLLIGLASCNFLILFCILLYGQLAQGRWFKTLFAVVPLAGVAWFYPKPGHSYQFGFPEVRNGYYVWATSVSVIALALIVVAVSAHLRGKRP